MTDDPREVLKAAGVECAEVDEWEMYKSGARQHYYVDQTTVYNRCDKTILALAQLVAKYKWQRDATVSIAGYNEEEAQELLDEVDLEWHEEERRRREEQNA